MKKDKVLIEDISKNEVQIAFSGLRLKLIQAGVILGWSLILIIAAYSFLSRNFIPVDKSLNVFLVATIILHSIATFYPWKKIVTKKNFELIALPFTFSIILLLGGVNAVFIEPASIIYFMFVVLIVFGAFIYEDRFYVMVCLINNLAYVGSSVVKKAHFIDGFFETLGLIVISSISYILAEEYKKERIGHLDEQRKKDKLIKKITTIRHTERRRIGRELHDGIGQALSSSLISLELISKQSNEPATKQQISELKDYVKATIEDIKKIVLSLKPTVIDDLGLNYALKKLVDEFNQGKKIEFTISCPDSEIALRPDIETSIFRITQETLLNILKHSEATKADVSLFPENGNLILEIADNGKGLSYISDSTKRDKMTFGLSNIKERVDLLSGRFSIQSRNGKGTKVYIEIPVSS